MNKKFLNMVWVISLSVLLIFFITAEENPANLSKENSSSTTLVLDGIESLSNLEDITENNFSFNLNSSEINEEETPEIYTNYNLNQTNITGDLSKENSKDTIKNNISNGSSSTLDNNQVNSTFHSTILSKEGGSSGSNYIGLEELNELDENISEGAQVDYYDALPTDANYTSLQIRGKKEIDIGGYGEIKITKEEFEKSEFEKEVIISSEEHYEGYLRVYASPTQESKEDYIKIYWKNQEDLEITNMDEFSVEYYDENENGLIDRISWIVPHLSEQRFDIVIKTNFSDNDNLIILDVEAPSSLAINPIEFRVNVSYDFPEKINCSLELKKDATRMFFEYFEVTNGTIGTPNLQNGNYTWEIICFDVDNSNASAKIGAFEISEDFSSSLVEGKLYFLNLVENKIKNPETIIINSSTPSNFSVDIIKNGGAIVFNKYYLNSASLLMNETILNSYGNYALRVSFNEPSPEYVILTNFSVTSANININTTNIEEGESVKITANVNSPTKMISTIILDYGDGTNDYRASNSNSFSGEFTKKYNQKGTYSPKLIITILGGDTFNITKNGITVTEAEDPEDKDPPSITLYDPAHKEVLDEEIINFSYKASDNIKIQNCTFKLYNNCASLNSCSTGDSNLIFPLNSQQRAIANNYSMQNNKETVIKLQDFEDGIYLWEVECYDNSSNSDFEWNIFQIAKDNTTIVSSDYEQKEEIGALKEQADNFLNYGFDLEEKEVLDGLNIINETKYYKKRLLDIQDFFEENYKYVSTEELRERKTEEYIQELEKIKNSIPVDISVEEDYEYIKNSMDKEFKEIIEEYFSSTNTQLSKASLRKLEEINKEIQNEISVSTNIKRVSIKYENGTQEMVFIKKKVALNDGSYSSLLEIIPEEIVEDPADIVFITEKRRVGEGNMFEIDYDDLINGEIIYYITKPIKLKDIENTETVLFEEYLTNVETRVTGFFVFSGVSEDLTIYIVIAFILLIVLLVIIPIVIKKFKMISWKKEPNVVKVIHLIEEINRLLKEREIEKARENYYKIKEIYPVLPYKTRPYFYKKISEMLVKIDKKDIFGLVKEYQEAKKRWDKENLMRLYEDIKKIYKRLPEKDRKKVYDIINGY